ncbi:hypothetical protein [Nocardia sp. SYP-A9097]|uniref:hypothetical protein n=1 Tax=Nocardia sp. SYP-A9097 TaxID=2663237 RepID=UPI00129AEBBC|nr:hypothetical protein [Nocardia sp. SYP-A9097]
MNDGISIRITSTGHTTTTRRVHAEFHTAVAGTDMVLADLRETLAAAAHLPDIATVQVYMNGAWRTPNSMLIEHSEQSAIEPQDADCGHRERIESTPKTLAALRASTNQFEDIRVLIDADPLLVRVLLLEAIGQLPPPIQ